MASSVVQNLPPAATRMNVEDVNRATERLRALCKRHEEAKTSDNRLRSKVA
jgi:hypothetical protein